jgi:hypothetical protein
LAPPYPQSWINRLVDRVDRLPGPPWVYYLAVASLLAGLQLVIQWTAGTYSFPFVDRFNVLVAVAVPYQIGLMHYLIHTSQHSLEEFRPAPRGSESEAEEL